MEKVCSFHCPTMLSIAWLLVWADLPDALGGLWLCGVKSAKCWTRYLECRKSSFLDPLRPSSRATGRLADGQIGTSLPSSPSSMASFLARVVLNLLPELCNVCISGPNNAWNAAQVRNARHKTFRNLHERVMVTACIEKGSDEMF